MKNWPAYKNYNRNCRNITEVIAFLKGLELEDSADTWYLKNYVHDKGIEVDDDYWQDSAEECGASVQIEFVHEYDPKTSTSVFTRYAAYDRETAGEQVVEPAHYEVRVTKYTKAGLAAQFQAD